jgi:hypothetical protein
VSNARARYLKARKDYDSALESEKNARQETDGLTSVINVGAIGVQYASDELVRARENFYSSFRESLAEHDPEFARLMRHANAAQAAFQQCRLMVEELKRVLSSSLHTPAGVSELDEATRTAHFALVRGCRELGTKGLEVVRGQLEVLAERAEEHQGRAYCYLEAAIEREEGRAA